MSKRIVIIGASDLQLPLILKAREMGYETHVFAWAAGDVGEKAADHFYPISITETDRILEECRKIQPVAVASIASDLAAIAVNKISNALGLPANPPETAVIATNKYEMRKTFLEAGLPVPQFFKVGNGDDLSEIKQMRLPVIVKPTDRSGSRGIFKLTSFDDLESAVAQSCSESFEHKVIVEEYIDGEEYSCECISRKGKHHCLAITKKYTTGAPHFIEIGHLEPSGLNEEICERVKEHVFRALDALHVQNGASHSEFKVVPGSDEIRLIEIGARMGGDCIGSDLVHLSTGYDFVRMVIQCAAGEEADMTQDPHNQFAAVRYIMNLKDYENYCSLNEEDRKLIVRTSEIRKPEKMPKDSSSRFGFYLSSGNVLRDVLRTANLS